MQQRYKQLIKDALSHSYYRNPDFFNAALSFSQMQLKLYEILNQFLLMFHSRKFKLDEFLETSKSNIQKLKSEFDNFLDLSTGLIKQLYTKIADPKKLEVKDSDIPQIKRRNPNVTQLLTLEKNKAIKRLEYTKEVNNEIREIGIYIRMIDYMILETLVDGCIKCWKSADENVSQSDASVFLVEVLFDDEGNVAFNPSHDDLINSISQTLDDSI